LITRLGITLLSLIPIKVKILTFTPAANAEIQSMTGTNVKRIANKINATTTAIIIKIELAEIIIIFLL
jgi:hypothetical protein